MLPRPRLRQLHNPRNKRIIMKRGGRRLAFAMLMTGAASSAPAQQPVVAPPSPEAAAPALDKAVRLMVMREVTTRTARPGDRFRMQVDQDVVVDGVKIIPAGTQAWGEVVSAETSGLVGKSGKLSARLLYIELPDRKIVLRGDMMEAGTRGGVTTAAATVGFALMGAGPLGLLTRGTNAKLKAGDILIGYVAADTIRQ
jgi:hypothetical protein